jgi:hypothetical protein
MEPRSGNMLIGPSRHQMRDYGDWKIFSSFCPLFVLPDLVSSTFSNGFQGFHIADMMFLQMNENMAHSFPQEYDATNWQFMSQPLATAAATLARSGMIWYLCQSVALGEHGKKARPWLITLMSIHFVFNIVPCLYEMFQCDFNAFQSTGNTDYFQYMWSPSSHGLLVCGDSRLQVAFTIAQGGQSYFHLEYER